MHILHNQDDWIARAKQVLPAGGFGNFDPSVFIARGEGSRVWDENGKEYIDYLIGSGPMLLGHGNPEVQEAVIEQLSLGMTFFANNSKAIELAEEIIRAVPCAEQLRYVSSGGEADMYAMRLARAFTGRDKIVKFEGGYHGMCAEAQMSLAPAKHHLRDFPNAVPDSAGIPASVQAEVLIAEYNDIESTKEVLDVYEGQVAAIIVEPLQRIIPPAPGFLAALRQECDKRNIVLIFDEVVTGFRFAYGGAQEYYGVTPDIATLGKVIGGGFPLAAVAGKSDILAHFDKSKVGEEGFLMQLGTLSGNPVAAIAGLKTMEILQRPGNYDKLLDTGTRLQNILSEALTRQNIAHRVVGHPALFDIVLTEWEVANYRDVLRADAKRSTTFNQSLRESGIFKSPSKLYPSLAINEADLDLTAQAAEKAVNSLCASHAM
ncbi:MAG: aminotransferase class III-fold pyridoxal phosphate-dependent enzyme [Pseudomonadota bacterium]